MSDDIDAPKTIIENQDGIASSMACRDTQRRMPRIANAMSDPDREPNMALKDALCKAFEAHSNEMASARNLMD